MHRPVDLISLSRVCVISAVTLVLACFTWSTQADAHEFPYCSGAGIRQPGSFVGFSINPGWGPTTQARSEILPTRSTMLRTSSGKIKLGIRHGLTQPILIQRSRG